MTDIPPLPKRHIIENNEWARQTMAHYEARMAVDRRTHALHLLVAGAALLVVATMLVASNWWRMPSMSIKVSWQHSTPIPVKTAATGGAALSPPAAPPPSHKGNLVSRGKGERRGSLVSMENGHTVVRNLPHSLTHKRTDKDEDRIR